MVIINHNKAQRVVKRINENTIAIIKGMESTLLFFASSPRNKKEKVIESPEGKSTFCHL